MIVAVSDNGVIGQDNDLPWHLSRDLRRFKQLTMGHHLILGRRTFEAIGRPLPGRTMIVLTRGEARFPEGVHGVGSLDEAVDRVRAAGASEAFVAGGETIYRQVLPRADRIYLTRVHADVAGDARFPELDLSEWIERSREHYPVSEQNEMPLTFFVLDKAVSGLVQSPANAETR